MRRYAIGCVLFLIAAVSPVTAVDTLRVTSPDPVLESWRYRTFDQSSGLLAGIHDIYEDREGNIWFATANGAQRYDGYRWNTYTTENGLPHNNVHTIIQSQDGAMWFATIGGGIVRFDGENWKTYTTADGLDSDDINWRGICQLQNGVIWAGFALGKLCMFNGTDWAPVEVPDTYAPWRTNHILEASDGIVWIATDSSGVLKFDGVRWTQYTVADGLAGNGAVMLLASEDGDIWVTCLKGGVSRFRNGRWRIYGDSEGLSGNVTTIWQTGDGVIWCSDLSGMLYRFDDERWNACSSEALPQLKGLMGVTRTDSNVVWFTAWNVDRAVRYDGSGKYRVFVQENRLFGGYPTADGSIWFGGTVSFISNKEWGSLVCDSPPV